MAMVFKDIFTPGIAQISYLIGDDSEGVAAVIDPRPDCEIYLEIARENGLTITHIFETHIHADFMSGARELAARLNNKAAICASGEGGATYGFDVKKIGDNDSFTFGVAQLTARHTPGHTPEHLSYEYGESGKPFFAVFTGDSLFADSVGRPDLLGGEQTEALVKQLHETIYNYFLKLPDHVLIHPCHGAGSACGPSIGNRLNSSIGFERKSNPFLQYPRYEDFKKAVLEGAPPAPRHYPRLKKINARGPEVQNGLPAVTPLTTHQFREMKGDKVNLLDTRSIFDFSGGHIEGAMNIAWRDELSVWGGWMLDPDKPILLVLEDDESLEKVVRLLWRVGFDQFAGYLAGGMARWANAGFPKISLPHMTVHQLKDEVGRDGLQVLDVRDDEEWKSGHIEGARHFFAAGLYECDPEGLKRGAPVATYCATGFRAMIAASILQARGFEKVHSVPGSITAWRNANYPLVKPSSARGEE